MTDGGAAIPPGGGDFKARIMAAIGDYIRKHRKDRPGDEKRKYRKMWYKGKKKGMRNNGEV